MSMSQLPIPKEPTQREQIALALLPRDAGDGKELDLTMLRGLFAWSNLYGLDPLAGHTILYFGRPFVTEKGMLYLAHRDKNFDGYNCSMASSVGPTLIGIRASLLKLSSSLVTFERRKEPQDEVPSSKK
jgi:hypothetical protein